MRRVTALCESAVGVHGSIGIELLFAVSLVTLFAGIAVEAGIDLSSNADTITDLYGSDLWPYTHSFADYF